MKKRFKIINLIVVALIFFSMFFSMGQKSVNAMGEFTVWVDNEKYYVFPPEINYGLNGVYINDINGLCERIYLDNLIKPVNATAEFIATEKTPFVYCAERWGRCVPKQKIYIAIKRALLTGKNQVKLKSEPLKPENSLSKVYSQTKLRATFSTYYGASSEGRKHNVELCAKSINGSMILPKQTFSFNGQTGERTQENGYQNAKVILDGEFTDGIGGGVCQVSTTLYNTALKAGLEVSEWHRHSLPVGYVQPSFDAMVSGQSDLKIKNNTESAVYISAFANGETLTVKIYGLKNEYEYQLKSYITEIIQAKTQEIKAESATEIVEKTARNGYKSEGYLCVYKNGKLLYNRKLREDVYNPINGVVLVS